MGVFHLFEIVQMVPNRTAQHIYAMRTYQNPYFGQTSPIKPQSPELQSTNQILYKQRF